MNQKEWLIKFVKGVSMWLRRMSGIRARAIEQQKTGRCNIRKNRLKPRRTSYGLLLIFANKNTSS
jgi:hypothetical protein